MDELNQNIKNKVGEDKFISRSIIKSMIKWIGVLLLPLPALIGSFYCYDDLAVKLALKLFSSYYSKRHYFNFSDPPIVFISTLPSVVASILASYGFVPPARFRIIRIIILSIIFFFVSRVILWPVAFGKCFKF